VASIEVFAARFGHPIMTPNLLHFGLKLLFQRLSEDVGTRGLSKDLTNPAHSKTQIRNRTQKKPSAAAKTHSEQNKMSTRVCRCVYVSMTLLKGTCLYLDMYVYIYIYTYIHKLYIYIINLSGPFFTVSSITFLN